MAPGVLLEGPKLIEEAALSGVPIEEVAASPRLSRSTRGQRLVRELQARGTAVRWLHDDPSQSYEYLSDVTAVEFRDRGMPIEVIWHLRSIKYRRFLRLKAPLAKGQPLSIASVWSVYKGADWLERECYDMFGVVFEGHPDLRRILMPEGFDGHPLRKEFGLKC